MKRNMEFNFNLLHKISSIPGAPGFESKLRDFVISEIKDLVDEISVDNLGNLIALRKGTKSEGKKVAVAAHMDEIAFMVKHIDDNGFLKFIPLGGFDPKTLTSLRVLVHGKKDLLGVMGSKPIHLMTAADRSKGPTLDEYYIDLGLPKEEVEDIVSVGDSVTRIGELVELGNCVSGKSLDNRISVFMLIETLKQLGEIPYDFYACFTVQEEVGVRGAVTVANAINPDFAIALDTTIAADTPGTPKEKQVTQLHKGATIKLYDGGLVADRRMVDFMKSEAIRNGIDYQVEVLPAGKTDASALQLYSKAGAITGAISVPTRYIHQTVETVSKKDVLDDIQLLVACLETIDKHHWD